MDRSSVCILEAPKYLQNLGAAVRACACFGVTKLIWTGSRISIDSLDRTPRELRMKAYRTVEIIQSNKPFDLLPDYVPVCIEILPDAMPLPKFIHPAKAVYVFGSEDGDVSQVFKKFCHMFVQIPSEHCLNLAAAMNVVLYDRLCKEAELKDAA